LPTISLIKCTPPHPHLHSFPTRRSSDLKQKNSGLSGIALQNPAASPRNSPALPGVERGSAIVQQIQPDETPFQGFCSMKICAPPDRKSTRLNSSHQIISYAVFCLKKKNI